MLNFFNIDSAVFTTGIRKANPHPMKKQNEEECQRIINLQDLGANSEACFLERKASVGPCFRPGMPFEEPSGITICVPNKKSTQSVRSPSGININMSRKFSVHKDLSFQDKRYKLATPDNKMDCEIAYAKLYNAVKGKVNAMRSKIKCAFNI